MKCAQRCNRRILLEDLVPLEGMVSLDVLRLRIPQDRLDFLIHEICIPLQPALETSGLCQDTFAIYVAFLCANGDLSLYVADRPRACGNRVRPEAMQSACRCWSLLDSICEGVFVTKPALLCHDSKEVWLSGQPLYVQEKAADRAFQRRPTPQKRLTEIIEEVIARVNMDDRVPTNAELERRVREYPEIQRVSRREILRIARQIKPEEWSVSGPRRRARDK